MGRKRFKDQILCKILQEWTQSINQVIYRFFQARNDAHLTVTCEV